MTISLRPYQEDTIARLRVSLAKHRRVILRMPTGAGKTVVATFMAKGTADRKKRVIFTCHRSEILHQIGETFKKSDVPYGIIAAGHYPNPYEPIQIASIDTLKSRIDRIVEPHLLIVDESHHVAATGWSRVVDEFAKSGSLVVGLTATPWRLSGEGLGRWFKDIVHGPEVSWLIQNGYLSDYRLFAPPAPDMSEVHSKMGDFVKSEVEEIVDKPQIVGSAIEHYLRVARGKKAVVYCVSIKHSQHVAAQFTAAGVAAEHVDGETDPSERKAILRRFGAGQTSVLTNCDLLGEGLDISALINMDVTIECIILLRPTKSLTLHLQQIGRGLRAKEDPAIILDHAGNTQRMQRLYGAGMPDDIYDWSLDDRKRRKKTDPDDGNENVQTRQCKFCFYVFRPAPACPSCGAVVEINPRDIKQVAGELVEIDKTLLRQERMREQGSATTLDELIAVGKSRGYKNPNAWAQHLLAARGAKKRA